MSGSLVGNYEFKFIKIVDTMSLSYIHYSIRNVSEKTNKYIHRGWRRGIIRTDKKSMYSSSFKIWVDLSINEDGRYTFERYNRDKGKFETYTVLDELINFVDNVIAETYLLGVS